MFRWIFAVTLPISVALAAQEKTALERGEYGPLDKAPDSALYDLPVKVSDHVYSAIGATQPPTYENAGHNNNLSFVIGSESVLVVNGGANNALARALHVEIKKVTDLPVRYVISENGQGHAMLGNHYWKSQDAVLIGHVDAQHEIDEEGFGVLSRMREYAQELAQDTTLVNFDITFEDQYIVELGDLKAIAKTYGSAHSPGDVTVLVPKDRVGLAGDMAFHIRMPPIFGDTDTALWIDSFDRFVDEVADWIIVPGHGGVTDVETVTAGTKDYLLFLRAKVQEILEAGGSLDDAYKIDQSRYQHWHTYEELAARNAGRVFERMEFE
ncbi:MAG: MBL fold metallo-hydrolase [Gammaproteobacteria bacterium]|nr:MBL fold metallo-hydrolase [Gammaproteobacteria bacterium]